MAQPLHAAHALRGASVAAPLGRKRATEAEHQFLNAGQRQVVGMELHRENHDIHVIEEIEVDVLHVKVEFRPVLATEAHGRHVMPPEHPDR